MNGECRPSEPRNPKLVGVRDDRRRCQLLAATTGAASCLSSYSTFPRAAPFELLLRLSICQAQGGRRWWPRRSPHPKRGLSRTHDYQRRPFPSLPSVLCLESGAPIRGGCALFEWPRALTITFVGQSISEHQFDSGVSEWPCVAWVYEDETRCP